MAYFLKKVKSFIRKDGVNRGYYLQIYESFYNKQKKETSHKIYKVIGYENELKANGIDDPIAYYQKEVDKLNKIRNEKKILDEVKLIEESPAKNIGHFLIKSVLSSLKVESHLNLLGKINDLKINLYDYLSDLISARVINPCSKLKTFEEVLPSLLDSNKYTLDQIYDSLLVIGYNYDQIIEIINAAYDNRFHRKTSKVYFDCTNYYFEIDQSYDDKQKGPSKENRNAPIIGMGLLLDEEQVPLTMQMYPGNQSEKPVIRQIINSMKSKNNITGKTIQVADKGLNCAQNIIEALKNKDGYIFSQSVKKLDEKEQKWVLLEDDVANKFTEIYNKDGSLNYKFKSCIDEYEYKYINENGQHAKVKLKQIRVVSFNPSLAKKQKQEIIKLIDKAKALSLGGAKRNEFGDASKFVDFKSVSAEGEIDENASVTATINQAKVDKALSLAGYNMIISSEIHMKPQEIYNVYHGLWRIEETFRILKSELNARPVYLQNKYSIYGHFLICYLSIFVLRVLQIKKFNDKIHPNEIINFSRNFNVLKEKDKYINLSSKNKLFEISKFLKLNILNYYFSDKDIKKILNYKI